MVKKFFPRFHKSEEEAISSMDVESLEVRKIPEIRIDLDCTEEIKLAVSAQTLEYIINNPDWDIFTLADQVIDLTSKYGLPLSHLLQKGGNIIIVPYRT